MGELVCEIWPEFLIEIVAARMSGERKAATIATAEKVITKERIASRREGGSVRRWRATTGGVGRGSLSSRLMNPIP